MDTLRLRFEERDGVPVQWLDERLAVREPEFVDLATWRLHRTLRLLRGADGY